MLLALTKRLRGGAGGCSGGGGDGGSGAGAAGSGGRMIGVAAPRREG